MFSSSAFYYQMKTCNRLALLVLSIGLLQMTGHLFGSKLLRGIGLATGISPFPKVFCEADGYEAFAARFQLEGTHADGSPWSCTLDPALYAKLKGPYNRRNAYGAALAFAPRLPADLRDQVLAATLRPGSALRKELDIPTDLRDLKVRITARDGQQQWTYR